MEVLLSGDQVIPPSQTICKKNQILGQPRTFKNPDQTFYILDGDDDPVAAYILQLFYEKFKENKSSITNSPIEKKPSPQNDSLPMCKSTSDKHVSLLFHVIQNKDRDWDKWFKIAGILKHNGYEYSVFKEYSDLLYLNSPETKKLWKSISNSGSMSIYGLHNIAKEADSVAYKNWLIEHNEHISLQILEKGENDVALYISNYLRDELVYTGVEWWEYNHTTHLWKATEEPSARITSKIQRKIDEALECTAISKRNVEVDSPKYEIYCKEGKKLSKSYSKVCEASFNSQVIKYLKTYLRNETFFQLLDNCMYKMAFQNGLFDIKTMTFREGITQTDYISKTLAFDYCKPTKDEVKWVLHELKKICNFNDEHLQNYLSNLGYALTGYSSTFLVLSRRKGPKWKICDF